MFGDPLREEAERAFDSGRFDLAEHVFRDLAAAGVPRFDFEARATLARAYAAWESLRFAEARADLAAAHGQLAARNARFYDGETLLRDVDRLASQVAVLDLLVASVKRGSRPDRSGVLANTLVRHLLAASRRLATRAPDEAGLLLYRATELSVQRRLAALGLDASEFRVTDAAGFVARFNELVDARHRITWVQIPLVQSMAARNTT